jgi:hypothetical protein
MKKVEPHDFWGKRQKRQQFDYKEYISSIQMVKQEKGRTREVPQKNKNKAAPAEDVMH